MEKTRLSLLSKNDLLELMGIAHDSLFCTDVACLKTLFSRLDRLISFNSICCAFGDLKKATGQENPDVHVLDISYPDEYLNYYLGNGFHLTDPVIGKFLTSFEPVNWQGKVLNGERYIRYTELVDAESFGMRDGWTYGTVYPDSGESSIFFMAGEKYDSSMRTRTIIEYIVPFLSEAYKRVINDSTKLLPDHNGRITLSEIEILNWLKEGKSSWEISVILNKSERVVNFHITNIIQKLNAMNRTHAVVIALKNNLITL